MAARVPRSGEGKRRSELPRAAGLPKVERRRCPGSQLKALRRSRRELAGRRAATGRARRGRCGWTGRGRARLRPRLETWEPGLPQIPHWGISKRKEKKKGKRKAEEEI